ncbi:MAG: NAD(+)/NADH kinase [Candidatus Dojkabacteria bacterium]|jgi:NAD+ kinase
MIKSFKLYPNRVTKSLEMAPLLEAKLVDSGFVKSDEPDLAIAVGGDGAFLGMVRQTEFRIDLAYVGVNTGTLGFLQEIKFEEIDEFVEQLQRQEYRLEEIAFQQTVVKTPDVEDTYLSLNEIVVRDKLLRTAFFDVEVDGNQLQNFVGDALLISTPTGSTAHNSSYGGAIVDNSARVLQLNSMGAINSKVYRSLINPYIIGENQKIVITPEEKRKDIMLQVDGEIHIYDNAMSITTMLDERKLKFLRMKDYTYERKIREKILGW